MSTSILKSGTLTTAAAIAIALASSTPVWAKMLVETASETSGAGGIPSQMQTQPAEPPDLRIAMMDMMDMKKMPADAPMPAAAMPDPMAAPSSADMMGRMRGAMPAPRAMSNMAPTARLPGFPGASRLYHVGATGFFLDHPEHITLSTQQQTTLNRLKEKTSLDRASSERRIEDAEQELWTLTAVDAPDAGKIDAKVRAIEKLRGDQRLAFIRAVGEAGKVLTPDQQSALLGNTPSPAGMAAPAAARPMPAPAPAMPPMKMQ